MIPLSEFLRSAWRTARSASREIHAEPAREVATLIAFKVWGDEKVMALPTLVNFAAWGWLAREHARVDLVRPSVPRLVAATDLHALPDEPPAMLRAPWCVEVQRPERGERLFGETWALAGYELDGVEYLIGLVGEGARVVPWRPRWPGGDLAEGIEPTRLDDEQLLGAGRVVPDPEHAAWGRDAVRWLTVYALLCDAAGSPLTRRREEPSPREARAKPAEVKDWSVSRVTLTPEGERVASPPSTPGEGDAAHEQGRVLAATSVRAHLKRQRFGPGRTEVRWIWVEGYAARRWVAPWTTRDVRAGSA